MTMRSRPVILACLVAGALLLLPASASALKFRRADGRIAFNPDVHRPANVPRDRFVEILNRSTGYWDVPVRGESTREPGRFDGVQVAGFSDQLPPQALGLWYATYHNVYRRVRRCRRTSSGALRCKRVRKYRYSVIDEADVMAAVRPDWNSADRHPFRSEFDLLTVLVHEFGHFARPNMPHRQGCVNTALIDSLANGEWWWNRGDWFRYGCANAPGRPRASRARPRAPTERGQVLTRLRRGPDEVR